MTSLVPDWLLDLDALAEPPVSAAALRAAVARNPLAASATARLLPSLDRLRGAEAQIAESLAYGELQGGPEHRAWLATRPVQPVPPAGRVHLERRDDELRITIDRPDARNAIDVAIRDRLHDAFLLADLDRSIRNVRLRAVGPAFSIGADLAEFGTTRDPVVAHRIRMETLPAIPLARRASIVDVHIQGACVGAGLEIAAFAGRITASPKAWFQLPELQMGLIPGAGGCVSISRRIGVRRAALMILSGRRIGAPTALSWGLIDGIEDLPPVDPGAAHLHAA